MDFSNINYEKQDDGFAIKFMTKAIKTPAKNNMVAPSEAMAKEIVAEWQKLDKEVDWSKLPLSRYLSAILDNQDSLDKWQDDLVSFAKNDLVCYLASNPKELKEKQEEQWLPLVRKINLTLGIELKTTFGIVPISQDDETLKTIASKVKEYDIFDTFILRNFAGILGSFVLGFSLFNGWIDKNEAYTLSLIDETWQEDHWGKDEEATIRREKIREELLDTVTIYKLMK